MIKRKKVLRKLYEIGFGVEIETIPISYIEFYAPVKYNKLIVPLVVIDHKKGQSLQQIANKYGVTIAVVRNIVTQYKSNQE